MLIKIGEFEFTECWDGVLYKKLADYPKISEWEIQTILDFVAYEEKYGRTCTIEADKKILNSINEFKAKNKSRIGVPKKITECTACPTYKGCMTDFVCHTSPVENAVKIFDCGSLLSPVKARKISSVELAKESRNAANDPEDYFDYIMFAWGNCQAGDRLVMERKLKRFPNETDLSVDFTPGVRFFFKYDEIIKHPNMVFDGVLPLKIKDEVILSDWIYAIVVPLAEKEKIEKHIPLNLKNKVHYIENDCNDIWEWSEKVYEYIRKL